MSLLFFLLASSAHAADASGAHPLDVPPVEIERTRPVFAERQRLLSGLWTFATLNYVYCDVIGLMDADLLRQYQAGSVDGVKLSDGFLLGGVLLMEVPMSMVVLSSALNPKASRVANISAGLLMTAVQGASLSIGRPTPYYLASSVVEMATTSFITLYAWRGLKPPRVQPVAVVDRNRFMLELRFQL